LGQRHPGFRVSLAERLFEHIIAGLQQGPRVGRAALGEATRAEVALGPGDLPVPIRKEPLAQRDGFLQ
jgi:hypothetical protein